MILQIDGSDHDQQAAQALLQEHGFKVSLRSGDNAASTELSKASEDNLPLAFLEHSIDGIAIHDLETAGVIYANSAFAEMLGYSLEEIRQLKVWDWDARWSREELERMLCAGNWPFECFESRHRRKDGQLLDVNISLTQHTWQGKEVCFCVIKDITERKKTERALHLMQLIVEKTGDQAHWLTPEGRFFYANEATCSALGYSREELGSMSIWDVDPVITREKYLENYPKLKKEGSMRFESVHRAKGGRIYPVEVHCNYVHFDGQEYCCAFARDISERKQREEALRFTQYVVDKTNDQAFWLTPEGRIHYANEAACASLGYSRAELEDLSIWDIDTDATREKFLEGWEEMKEKGALCFERRHRAKDGCIYLVEVRANYVNFDGKEFCCAFSRDISKRKQKEEALRFTQYVVDKTGDQALWVTTEGRIHYVNEAACANLGYSREELEGMWIWEIDPNFSTEKEAEAWQQLREKGSLRFESLNRAKDGHIYPVEVRSNYVVFDGKEHCCAFITDISERKQKEAALRLNQFAMDNTADQAFWVTPEGGISYANNAACAALGYSSEELVGMSVSDIDPNFSSERLVESWESLKAVKSRCFESCHKAKDGRIYPVEIRSSYVNFDGQELRFCFVNDISQRKAAEEALRRSEERYRQLMEMLPIAAYTTDAEGRITFFNRKAKSLWQRAPRLKQDLWCGSYKIYYPDGRPMPHDCCPMALTLKTGEACQGREIMVENPDGSFAHALAYPERLLGADGQMEGAVNLLFDITERKRAEEALENRLVALTQPLDDAAGVTFEELFNPADIQRLQDDFARATGVASLITLPDGTPLTEPSNFCRLCDMIRATEKGTANCRTSDAALGRSFASGPTVQKCLSAGLWGAGAAIKVGGRHVANWLIGQVRDENMNEEQMRAYARQVDADEEIFVEAFREVPIMSGDRFRQVAQALYTLAEQLSSIAYQNVQQARFITDHKRAEEALRKSERKYRSIVEHAPFGITRSTRDGKLLSANPALASILKYDSAEELMETIDRASIQEVLFPCPSEREPLVADILSSDSWYKFNNKLRCKDGSSVFCRVHSRRILDKDGQASAFESYQENITDQLAAEEALRESEEKFRVLAETSPVAIGLYQGEYIIYANPAMERLFGFGIGEFCGMSFLDGVHEDYKELVRSRASARLAGESVPCQYEIKCVTKEGEERDVLVSAGTMKHRGSLVGVASFLDITERKKSEKLLRASLAEKEVLLKEIHHRVKNNLQVVSSLLFLQAQRFSDPELQNCFLESQSRICSMALAHEQLYQSKNLYEISVKSYVESLVGQLEQVFQSPEQEVGCRLVVENVPLDIEKVVPCGLLVTELLSNAYKHAFADGRSGQVTVSLQSENGQIELKVADDGIGLPAEFDHRQPKTLGLQLVSALVNQLGGELEVETDNGACFRVNFAG